MQAGTPCRDPIDSSHHAQADSRLPPPSVLQLLCSTLGLWLLVPRSSSSVLSLPLENLSVALDLSRFSAALVCPDAYLPRIIYMRYLYVELACKYLFKYRIYNHHFIHYSDRYSRSTRHVGKSQWTNPLVEVGILCAATEVNSFH